jgi:hypothetical protein
MLKFPFLNKKAAEKSVYGCPHVIAHYLRGVFSPKVNSESELTIFSVQQ